MAETLWNYGLLRPQDQPQLAMMGVQVAREVWVAFAIGCAFVAYFAWDRFKKHETKTDDFRYLVMKEAKVEDLGGSAALRQARLIYLITLLSLYVAMTFFGKLIVQTANALNVVGIQVDSSSLQFDSPQWPLTLAFGFAGLAPLIPPLQTAEAWLFRRAYRAVGIPVRIHQTTGNLIDILDAAAATAYRSLMSKKPKRLPEAQQLSRELKDKLEADQKEMKRTWVLRTLEKRPARLESILTLLAQLEILVEWARGKRGAWPGSEVSDKVRALEQGVAGKAEKLLDGFDKRLRERAAGSDGADGDRTSGPPSARSARGAAARAASAAGADGDRTSSPPIAGTDGDRTSGPPSAGTEERREAFLTATIADARALRDELVAFLAVYVERDPTYVGESVAREGARAEKPAEDESLSIRAVGLRELMRRADPPNLAGTGPEFGVLLCIVFAMPIYAIFAWKGLHPLLAPNALPDNLNVVLATAGVEALKLMSIAWLPLLAAFGLRQYYYDEGTWVAQAGGDESSAYTEQRLAAIGLAFVVSVVCLSGVATLWAFFIARDVSSFKQLLVGGANPFLLFYPTMASVTVPLVWLTLAAADARARGRPVVAYGVGSVLLVLGCQIAHLAFWYSGTTCTRYAGFLTDLFTAGCFRWYGGLDFFVLPTLAYLAAVVFGNPRAASLALRRLRLLRLRRQSAAAAAAVALVCVMGSSLAALSQGRPTNETVTGPTTVTEEEEDTKQPTVRIGFREDAEPFSYKADGGRQDGDQPLYEGFLADLCYWIFRGTYTVEEVKVETGNRFKKLENGEIDVLCDPVTLRFSEPERAKAGIFSPVVFATGITYLEQRVREARTSIYIGYARGSTAERAAQRACEVDLFGIVPPDQKSELAVMCETAWAASRIVGDRLLNVSDWKRVLSAAEAERYFAGRREEAASDPKKPPLTASISRWDDTIKLIKSCKAGSKCDLTTLAKQLGNSCADLEPPLQARATEKAESIPWTRTTYRFCPEATHTKLIDWFCKQRLEKNPASLVYLGDREIILWKLRTWNEQHGPDCDVENPNGADDLTYEPYALMVARPSKDDPNDVERRMKIAELVQRRIYEFFSFGSQARDKFNTYFVGVGKDRKMSTALAYLFLLNGVEDDWRFSYPEDPANAAN